MLKNSRPIFDSRMYEIEYPDAWKIMAEDEWNIVDQYSWCQDPDNFFNSNKSLTKQPQVENLWK